MGNNISQEEIARAKSVMDEANRRRELMMDFVCLHRQVFNRICDDLLHNVIVSRFSSHYVVLSLEHAVCLARVIKVNKCIQQLELRGCGFSLEAARHVADALKVNHTITELVYEGNHFGVDFIVGALNNCVTRLDLSSTSLEAKGAV